MKISESRTMHLWLILAMIAITFNHCNPTEPSHQPTTFDDDKLPAKQLQAQEFGIGEYLLSPFRAKIIDSILIISDYGGNPLLMAYDLRKKEMIKKFGTKGRGPGEFLSAWNLTIGKTNNSFSVYDPILKKMAQYNLLDRIPTFKNEIQLNNEDFFIYADWMTNDKIAYTSFSPKGRLVIYNVPQKELSFIANSTPPNETGVPKSVHSHAYHATVETTASGDKIAICSRYADQIELYKQNGDKIATVVGPEGYTPIYSVVDANGSPSMAETGKTKLAFLDIACTDEFVYVLYSGKNHEDYPGLLIEHGETVYVFDWEGNPVKKYKLDKGITSMGLSEDQSFIYGTSMKYKELVDVLYFRL